MVKRQTYIWTLGKSGLYDLIEIREDIPRNVLQNVSILPTSVDLSVDRRIVRLAMILRTSQPDAAEVFSPG